jgi:hypothetical protein
MHIHLTRLPLTPELGCRILTLLSMHFNLLQELGINHYLCRRRVVRYFNEDRRKRDYARSISRKTARFRLLQALLKSNSPTSSIVVLYCGKIGCPDELRVATYIVKRTAL